MPALPVGLVFTELLAVLSCSHTGGALRGETLRYIQTDSKSIPAATFNAFLRLCVPAGGARPTSSGTQPTGQNSGSGPTRHVELRGDSPAAEWSVDRRQQLFQLADKTLPWGLPEDLRRQRVSQCCDHSDNSYFFFPTEMLYMTVNMLPSNSGQEA